MYTVVIVDDEMLARIGLKSMIEWEENGFKLVGEAENGAKALDLIKQVAPDIVIADSKMPVMDGVDLLKNCREAGIETKFIMLSAYGNYEYVRNTLKNGAVDYLLKLEMEPQRLLAALNKAAEEINKVSEDKKLEIDSAQLLHQYRILISEPWSDNSTKYITAIEKSAYPSNDSYFILCRIIDYNGESISDNHFHEVANSLSNTIEGIFKDYGNTAVFPLYRTGTMCIIISFFDSNEDELSRFSIITSRLTETIKYMFNFMLYFGISTLHKSLKTLNLAYQEANSAAQKALLLNIPFCSASIDNNSDSGEISFEHEIVMLEKAVNELDSNEIRRIYALICVQNTKISVQQLTGMCYVFVFIFSNICRKLGIDESVIIQQQQEYYRILQKMTGHEEKIGFIKQLEKELLRLLGNSDSNRCIAKAKLYIQDHVNEMLSLEIVADHVGLSSGYFSKLFRQQTGLRFTEYVNKQRINCARGMLLSGDYMISDVALALGFENITYFSKLFHKMTGVTPQAYKQGGGKN